MFSRQKFCWLLLVPVSFGAQATTYTVTSNADGGGTCPDAANCTLRDAIAAATSGDDIIVFNGGMTITLASTLTLSNGMTIEAIGQTVAVDGNNSVAAFQVDAGTPVQITHLTIQNGLSNAGGGIHNQGTLTLTDSTLSNNRATGAPDGKGGGIYNSGMLTLVASTLSGNSASGGLGTGGNGSGGGIYNSGTLTLTNSTLSGNSARGGWGHFGGAGGRGANDFQPGDPSGDGGDGGDAGNGGSGSGGGIYNSGTLTLTNSTLSGNSAWGADGGDGGHGGDGGWPAVNPSGAGFPGGNGGDGGNGGKGGNGKGGGIYDSSFAIVMLTNSTLSDNVAIRGYGGYGGSGGYGGRGGFGDSQGASGSNGGSGQIGSSGDYSGYGVNSAGGIVTFTRTIVADGCAGTPTDAGGNIDAGSSCGFGGGSQSNIANLELGALANNGGPTQTMLPGAGSAAINSIACTNAPLVDQRNYLRPDPSSVGLATPCDVGAVEVGSMPDRLFANGFGPSPIYQ